MSPSAKMSGFQPELVKKGISNNSYDRCNEMVTPPKGVASKKSLVFSKPRTMRPSDDLSLTL
jgi:hypothetical protein